MNLLASGRNTIHRIGTVCALFLILAISFNISRASAADLVIDNGNSGTQSNPTVYEGGDYDRLLITNAAFITVRNAAFNAENDGTADFGVAEITNGINSADTPPYDIQGQSRDHLPDMGAWEYIESVGGTPKAPTGLRIATHTNE